MKAVHGEIPGVVKLINRTRWIQVCSSSQARHCPTIYKAVNTAVEKTVKRFEHTGIGSPIVTVLCPIKDHKDHYCLLSADKKEFSLYCYPKQDWLCDTRHVVLDTRYIVSSFCVCLKVNNIEIAFLCNCVKKRV